MGRKYFYTAASLPLLTRGKEPPFSLGQFLGMCRAEVAETDQRALEQISLNPESIRAEEGVLARWKAWETSLRNALVSLRSKRRGVAAEDYREESGRYSQDSLVRQIAQMESPLQAEIRIDQARWQFLEDEEMGHYFDQEVLLIYGLKLLLLERESRFREELGFRRYKEIYEQIMAAMDQQG